jgi:phosphoribosylanthranilate isomerase
METRLRIKVCGMRETKNLSDIAELKPDLFGLIFYPGSPRFIPIEKAETLPRFRGIEYVGVFVNVDVGTVRDYALRLGLYAIQLHGQESPEECRLLREQIGGIKIIKAFGVGSDFTGAELPSYRDAADLFLFDTKTSDHGGSGRSFDWEMLRGFEIARPFFLSGGIGPENATEAIKACDGLPLYGLDLNSRVETAPGIKSRAKIEQLLRSI